MAAEAEATGRDAGAVHPEALGTVRRVHPLHRAASKLARRRSGLVLESAMLGAVTAACSPALLRMPLAYDSPYYLHTGQVVRGGGMPYRDIAENKGPLNGVVFAGLEAATGRSSVRVKLAYCLAAGLTASLLKRYVGSRGGQAAGGYAAWAYATLAGDRQLEGLEPNTEQVGTTLVVAALAAARGRTPASDASAGALLATTVLFNPVFAALAPPVVAELAAGPARAGRLRAAAGGFAAVLAPTALWMLRGGAVREMRVQLRSQARALRDNSRAHQQEDSSAGWLPAPALWGGAAAATVVACTKRETRPAATLAAFWLIATGARLRSAAYVYRHHAFIALPGMAAAIGAGAAALEGRHPRLVGRVLIALPLHALATQAPLFGKRPQERRGVDHPYAVAPDVAATVRDATRPGEKIIVAGGGPAVHWLSGRPAPTRWIDTPPIRWWPEGATAEREHALLADRPRAICRLPGGVIDPAIRKLLDSGEYELCFDRRKAQIWLRT